MVKDLCEVVTLMFNIKAPKVNNKQRGDQWKAFKAFLADSNCINQFYSYDALGMSDYSFKKIKKGSDAFNLPAMKKNSKAASDLAQWVQAIVKFREIMVKIDPMKDRLVSLKEEYDIALEKAGVND